MKQLSLCLTIVLLLVSGCSTKVGYFISSLKDPLEPRTIKIDKDTESLYYTFSLNADKPDTFLFFIGGSGCASHKYYLRQYLSGLEGNIRVFALQKRGVEHSTTGIFGCSESFYYHDYSRQWAADQQAFLERILEQSQAEPQRVVMLGVSEGCSTATELAAKNPAITHLAMIGCGGMKFIDEMRLLSAKKNIPIDVDREYRKIMSDPESTSQSVAGHTYKYWASVLNDEYAPMKQLLSLDIPILAAMGEEDESIPVESIYFMRERFDKAGKHNLTTIIYPEADHTLKAAGKDYKPDFMGTLGRWIKDKS